MNPVWQRQKDATSEHGEQTVVQRLAAAGDAEAADMAAHSGNGRRQALLARAALLHILITFQSPALPRKQGLTDAAAALAWFAQPSPPGAGPSACCALR